MGGRSWTAARQAARDAASAWSRSRSGAPTAGVRASQSHTGALAGANEVWDAAFRRCGAIVAEDMQHLLDVGVALDALAGCGRPAVGVVSMSGGAAALMADRAARGGARASAPSSGTAREPARRASRLRRHRQPGRLRRRLRRPRTRSNDVRAHDRSGARDRHRRAVHRPDPGVRRPARGAGWRGSPPRSASRCWSPGSALRRACLAELRARGVPPTTIPRE